MPKFRDMETLQKFASVHATIHNHFHRNVTSIAATSSRNRSAALAEWRQLSA